MEFKIDRDIFAGALAKAQGIAEKRSTQVALANVLLQTSGKNSLRIASTDLDVTLQGGYPAEILGEGSASISAKSLYDIVRALPAGPLSISSAENHWLHIQAGKIEYKIVGMPADSFPALPSVDDVKGFPMGREQLLNMVDRVLFSVSVEETRPNLNGVFVQALTKKRLMMVSTDGHRLSKIVDTVDTAPKAVPKDGVIIPRKGLGVLRRTLDESSDTIFFGFQGSSAVFRSENEILFVRLIDGSFPDFNAVIQSSSKVKGVVERLGLVDALRRVSIVSAERTKGVRVSLFSDHIHVETTNADLGEAREDVAADIQGLEEGAEDGDFSVGYNARYVIEALSALSDDEITMETNDKTSPTLLRNRGDEESFYVVMPMRF